MTHWVSFVESILCQVLDLLCYKVVRDSYEITILSLALQQPFYLQIQNESNITFYACLSRTDLSVVDVSKLHKISRSPIESHKNKSWNWSFNNLGFLLFIPISFQVLYQD